MRGISECTATTERQDRVRRTADETYVQDEKVREHGGNEEARQRRSASETDVRDQKCDCMAAMKQRDEVRSTVRQDDQEVNDSGKQRSNGVIVCARIHCVSECLQRSEETTARCGSDVTSRRVVLASARRSLGGKTG